MKKIKKSLKKLAPKMLNLLAVFLLVLQPVGVPSLIAIASESSDGAVVEESTPSVDVSSEQVEAEEETPAIEEEVSAVEETTPTVEESTSVVEEEPVIIEEAPVVEESIPVVEEPATNEEIVVEADPADSTSEEIDGDIDAYVAPNVEADSVDLESIDPENIETAALATDKADYAPTDTTIITGTGFAPNTDYTLTITSNDEPPVIHEVTVTADENGEFVYAYQLDGNYRPNYQVVAKDDSGDKIAETTFTDADNTITILNDIATPLTPNQSGINFSGRVETASGGAGVPNNPIELRYDTTCYTGNGTNPNVGNLIKSASTDSSGNFSDNFTVPATTGTFQFWVYFPAVSGSGGYQKSGSDCKTIVIGSVISDQTITVTTSAPASATYGSSFSVAATASSGLPVAITTTGGCTGSGSGSATITMTSGTTACVVHYNQDGNASYNPAPEVTESTTVQKTNTTTVVTCPASAIYTGSAIEPCTATVTGPGGLSQSLTVNYTNNVNAGTATASASYAGDDNYNSSSDSATFEIEKAASVTIVTCPASVTYNGSAQTPCTVSVTGAGGLNLTPTPNYINNVNAGIATASYTYAGDANHNGSSDSETFEITKADATCNIFGYTGVYDGDAHGASGSCLGIGGENAGTLDLGTTYINVPGGTAHWVFIGNGNYNDQSGDVEIIISKADPICTVTPYDVTYDGDSHTANGSCLGVKGETLSGLDLSGTTHTNAGTYADNWTFTDVTGNYNNTSGAIEDKIAKAEANISVTGWTGTYDGNAHGASGTATGVKGEDLSSLLDFGATFTDVPGGTANWTFAGNTNYNSDSGSVEIIISKADANCTITGYNVIYDANPHTATGSCLGAKEETLSGLDLSGTTHTNAGTYTDSWTFIDVTGNYNNTSGTVSDIIQKAEIDCSDIYLPPILTFRQKDFQKMSTLPVKFKCVNQNDEIISYNLAQLLAPRLDIASGSGLFLKNAESSGKSNDGNYYRYTGSQFIFNLSTKMTVFLSKTSYMLDTSFSPESSVNFEIDFTPINSIIVIK